MTVTRCASSHLMTGLLVWRNPQGSEENWMFRAQGVENRWKHAGRVICSEIALVLLTITSAVETVAYSALAIASLTLYPLSNKPCAFFAKLLQSSSFTIIWGLADAIFFNPLHVNVMTQESYARHIAEMSNPTSIVMFRLDDRQYLAALQQRHGQETVPNSETGPILAKELVVNRLINQGADFILQEVLANASDETIDLFRDMDPSIFLFILTKAVFIYTAGAKKNDEVPNFFKPENKKLILDLRKVVNNEETIQEIERLVTSPTEFETEPQSEPAKSVFSRLRQIASGELQNSVFTAKCFQRAVEMLP